MVPNLKKPMALFVAAVTVNDSGTDTLEIAGDVTAFVSAANGGDWFRIQQSSQYQYDTTENTMEPGPCSPQWGGRYLWSGYRRMPGISQTAGQDPYYCWNRWYLPSTGRWTTPDPAMSPWGNLLEYSYSSPLQFADSSGLAINVGAPILGEGKYACCSSEPSRYTSMFKHVDLRFYIWFGANGRGAQDIEWTNNIFNQCCIKVRAVGVKQFSKSDTEWAIGDNLTIQQHELEQGVTYEDPPLVRRFEKWVIPVYYTKLITDKHGRPIYKGYAYSRYHLGYLKATQASLKAPAIAIDSTNASDTTLAHEIGHVLLEDGPNHTWRGKDYPAREHNLMDVRARDGSAYAKLTEEQCDKARQSSFAQGGPQPVTVR